MPSVSIAGLDVAALAELLSGTRSDLAAVAHTLAAHALASAESFGDLLSLSSLAGVEKHAYQIETVRRVLRALRGRALLADEVGLGKTIEAIMVLREYQLRGMARRVLILVPPPLVAQWAGELQARAGVESRRTDDAQLRLDPDDFWRGEGVVVASLALARSARHAPAVQAHPWDLVIIDEAHHLKSRTTLAWKLVDGLKSRFLLLLTATPIENDLEELYQLVTLLKPGQFPTPAAFRKQFVDPKDPSSPKNRERLRALLGEVMIRNTRAQSGLKLPPRFVTTIAVEPSPEERALYDRIVTLLRTHAEDGGARRAAATLLVEAGSSPHAVRATLEKMREGERHGPALVADLAEAAALAARVAATRKGEALVELLRAHGDQALVFSRFRHTLSFLDGLLTSENIPHVSFHGGLDGAAKREAIEAFRGGARVLLASDVGGEGQNLQFCHLLVNFDLPWNPMMIEQRIGRLHRFGQTAEVQVYNLCARGTVEERVLDVLDRRVHLFELVVGEMDMVLGNLADERDLEERILALYAAARSEPEIDRGFDAIADELLRARGAYEKTRALDEALFGQDFET
ncbi:MAG: DEAD/DEAH box helicase [Myxococcales bacterium]|nr:DEAD/DEAH box helicase [Myxococcales bacterium]